METMFMENLIEEVRWVKHPVFEGVFLKHILVSKDSGGAVSLHIVHIEPGKKIGSHTHEHQVETHEVLKGRGTCVNNGILSDYEPGATSLFEQGFLCIPMG